MLFRYITSTCTRICVYAQFFWHLSSNLKGVCRSKEELTLVHPASRRQASLSFPRRVPWQMSVRDKNRRTEATPFFLPMSLATPPYSVLGLRTLARTFLHTTHDPSLLVHRSFPSSTTAISKFSPVLIHKGPLSLITIVAAGILLLFGHAKATAAKNLPHTTRTHCNSQEGGWRSTGSSHI